MTPAPIALFVYNRPEHTRRTVEALQRNVLSTESDLIIFSDGPRNAEAESAVHEVRAYLSMISGFKNIHIVEREENFGLAQSIISGVTDIVARYGKVIVLEDDLVTSPYFLQYMNDGLACYEQDARVVSIHGYVYPVKKPLPETFFLRGADCWGWATWKRGWDMFRADGTKLLRELEEKGLGKEFDLDGSYPFMQTLRRQISKKNDSWAIRWHAAAFLADKLTLYPGTSLVDNIGQDASGTHGTRTEEYRTSVAQRRITVGNIPIQEDRAARKIIVQYFRSLAPNLLQKIRTKLVSIFNV